MIQLIPLDRQNESHLQLMYQVRTHPQVALRLSGPPPQSYEQHLHYLQKIVPDKPIFIIALGPILCGYCHLTITSPSIELGWALHPSHWGRSIGTQAVSLLLAHTQKTHPNHLITLVVKKDNAPALHIYRKQGFIIASSNDDTNEFTMHYKP